jgi:hypothetical protein
MPRRPDLADVDCGLPERAGVVGVTRLGATFASGTFGDACRFDE